MRRLNVGSGVINAEGWTAVDVLDFGHNLVGDIMDSDFVRSLRGAGYYDYIVANHLLSCFSHHELLESQQSLIMEFRR